MLGACRSEEIKTTVLGKIFCVAKDILLRYLVCLGLPGPCCHLEVFTQESVQHVKVHSAKPWQAELEPSSR